MQPDLNKLSQGVSTSIQQATDLPAMLRQAITSKLTRENPLIQQREKAVSELLSAPEQAGLDFSQPRSVTIGGGQVPAPGQNPVGDQSTVNNVYFSPQQQRALVSQRMAAKTVPVMTLNDIIGAQYGGLENIISQTSQAYEGRARQKQAEFDNALKLADFRLKSLTSGGGGGTKLTSAEKTKLNFLQAALSQVERLKGKSPDFEGTGPIAGRLSGLLENTPLRSDKLSSLQSDLGPVRDSILNYLSGAGVSGPEQKRVSSWIPSRNKSPKTNLDNLSSLENYLIDSFQAIADQPYVSNYVAPTKSDTKSSGTIRVRQKSSGLTGSIPANEFNSSLYERI